MGLDPILKHPLGARWKQMIQRCCNPSNKNYSSYGGRGIKVSESWRTFENFAFDMGIPEPGMTLERINNDGDYCKENCRWAARLEQRHNQRIHRNAIILEHEGRKLSLKDWSKELGIDYQTLLRRKSVGKTTKEILKKEVCHSKWLNRRENKQ